MTGAHSCGGCTLCCQVMPVKEIGLKAYTRCSQMRDGLHAAGPGCAIYANRPYSCAAWSCVWLKSADLPDALRPDRSGLLIDELIDVVRVNGEEHPCAQIWVTRGHETDFDKPLVQGAINGLIDKGLVVLWRLPPDADGQLMGQAILRAPDGRIGISPPVPADAENNTLGPERERMARANALVTKRRLKL